MGVTSNAKPTAVSAGGRNLRVVGSRPQSAPAGLQTTYATQFSSPPSRLRPGTARPTDRKPSGSSPRAAAAAPESKEQVVERIMKHLRERMATKRIIAPVFREMDTDRSGQLSYDEFADAMRRLGFSRESDEKLKWVAEAMDADGDGNIDYTEFAQSVQRDHDVEQGLMGSEVVDAASGAQERRGVVDAGEVEARPQSAASSKEAIEPAAAAAANALRKKERAAEQERLKVQRLLNQLRTRLEERKNTAAVFRNLDSDKSGDISATEFSQSLLKLGMPADDATVAQLMRELDVNADGAITYREFVERLLGRLDIDHTGSRRGARGAGGYQVEMVASESAKPPPPRRNPITSLQRHEALMLIEQLRERLRLRHANNVGKLFARLDINHDGLLSYSEFDAVVRRELPTLSPAAPVTTLCQLIDANADGYIDFGEFSRVVAGDGERGDEVTKKERMQQSGMQLAKNYEWMELDERKAKGRHAYVPVDTFGFRVREMFQPLPGTPYYATDEERLQPPLSQTRTPEWIARAKERGTSLREARHAICRANQAKVDALASRRQRRHEAMYERRLDGLFEQKSRWLQSVGSMGRPAATVEAAH